MSLVVNNTVSIWEDQEKLKEIRKIVSATPLTDMEFTCLIELGKATQLNPFLKEIWAVKYKQGTSANIFIGRDGYRKAAQRHPDYEWHEPVALYENDIFKRIGGEIHHEYNMKNRGELLGAYCLIKRKSSARPVCVEVSLQEYSTGQSMWRDAKSGGKPETMIKKVAEAQALRMCFQEMFQGTYSDSEVIKEEKPLHLVDGLTQTDKLNNILGESIIDEETGELMQNDSQENAHDPISENQINALYAIMTEKEFSQERIDKIIDYILTKYKITNLFELTNEQAQKILSKLKEKQ